MLLMLWLKCYASNALLLMLLESSTTVLHIRKQAHDGSNMSVRNAALRACADLRHTFSAEQRVCGMCEWRRALEG